MKRQGCLFLILMFLISLKAEATAFAEVYKGYTPTKSTINSFYNDFIVSPSLFKEGLAYFKARIEGEDVYLDWGIQGDLTTSHFVVQRRTTSDQFWTIGGIKERGTKEDFRKYSYKDVLETNATSYRQYRLKQIFEDGSFIYHKTITILALPAEKVEVQRGSVTDEVSLVLPYTDANSYQISIFSVSGRLLDKLEVPATRSVQSFNLSRFSPGLMVFVVESGENRWSEKIIKY